MVVPTATRVARSIGVGQAAVGLVLGIVLVVDSRRTAHDCSNGTCGFRSGGMLIDGVMVVLFSLAVYLPPAVGLRRQPRGEWLCLLLVQALMPAIVLIADIETGSWPVRRWISVLLLTNLIAVALLVTPAAIRYAWQPATDPQP